MKQPKTLIIGGFFNESQQDVLLKFINPTFIPDDLYFSDIIKKSYYDVYVTIGKDILYKNLLKMDLKERKKWVNYENPDSLIKGLSGLYYCFVSWSLMYLNDKNMITVFTTSYKSGKFIDRPYRSLMNQTYTNFEWIIFDDTPDTVIDSEDGCNRMISDNAKYLSTLKDSDCRIRIYRSDRNSGIIGEVKNIASSLARGKYVLELDHDDDITPDCLEKVSQAFDEFPDAGFAYSDCMELYENNRNFHYGEHFGMSHGAYRKVYYNGIWRDASVACPINSYTLRYITGVPNHIRAWKKETLQEIGGWNYRLHVADDYEILLRTFLHTKMVRIPHLLYLQYRNEGGSNFTFIRNEEIQKLTRTIHSVYKNKIDDHFKKINVKNYDWPDFSHPIFDTDLEIQKLNYVSHSKNIKSYITEITEIDEKRGVDILTEKLEKLYSSISKDNIEKYEIIIIGIRCDWMDKFFNLSKYKSVQWWNLENGYVGRGLSYAEKLVSIGDVIKF